MSIRENKRGRKKETEGEEKMVKTKSKVRNIVVKHLYFQFEHSIYMTLGVREIQYMAVRYCHHIFMCWSECVQIETQH